MKREEFEEAIAFFDQVLEMNPENADAWNNKGVALFQLGRPVEALAAYDRALQADSESREPLRNRAFVLRTMGRFEEALEIYEAIITDEPEASDFRNLATVLVGMGLLEEALGALMDAANLEPSIDIEREIEALRRVIMEVAIRSEFGGVFTGDGTGKDHPGEG